MLLAAKAVGKTCSSKACDLPATKWAAQQALPHYARHWVPHSDMGKGRGVKRSGPSIPHPSGSSCLGVLSAG